LAVQGVHCCAAFDPLAGGGLPFDLNDHPLLTGGLVVSLSLLPVNLEKVFLWHLVGDGAFLHTNTTTSTCSTSTTTTTVHLGQQQVFGPSRVPVPVIDPVVGCRALGWLGDPRVVAPFGDGPGLEVLLVLGLGVEGRLGAVVLVLGLIARLGPDRLPVPEVLARHGRAAGGDALLGDAAPRRLLRLRNAVMGMLMLRMLVLVVRQRGGLRLDALQLGDVGGRVLGEHQRHGQVRLVQLRPQAGHAAGPGDAGPRHAEGDAEEQDEDDIGGRTSSIGAQRLLCTPPVAPEEEERRRGGGEDEEETPGTLILEDAQEDPRENDARIKGSNYSINPSCKINISAEKTTTTTT